MKVSIHTSIRIDTRLAVAIGLVGLGLGLGLGLASQASSVYLPRMAIHMATGEASRVYSISFFTFHTKVSIHSASLEIVHSQDL